VQIEADPVPSAEKPGVALFWLTPPRFLAALAVLISHVTLWVGPLGLAIPNFVRAGFLGVPFFFVLSGFILAHVYCSSDVPINKRRFWVARFARIYPAYFLGLILTLPSYVRLLAGYAHARQWNLIVEPVATLALVHSWFPFMYMSWNGVGWTLGVEAFFYLAFPFVAGPISRLKPTSCLVVVAALWMLIMLRFVGIPDSTFFFNRSPIGRLPEFLTGILLCTVYRTTPKHTRQRIAAPLLICSVIALILVLMNYSTKYRQAVDGGTLAPIFGALIFALACLPSPSGRLARLGTLLGEASYAMYILQGGIIWIAAGVLRRMHVVEPMILMPAVTVAVVAGGVAAYLRWERPLQKRLLQAGASFGRNHGNAGETSDRGVRHP